VLWIIASVLLLVWIVSLAFEVAVGAIHLLVVVALALYLYSFLRGRARTTT
jgi:hypothetical protein